MKQARIYMKRWLGINERSKQLSTDTVFELCQSTTIFDR